MRDTPPAGFELSEVFKGIYTFQKWEIFPGIATAGPKDVVATMRALGVPDDLTGKRVLDIAPWNGFFGFECARRGASEVVALGPEDPTETGFAQVRDALGADNVRYIRGSVYHLNPAEFGMFDIVLFLGVIYHLRHPLLALDRIHDVCLHRLYSDTPLIDTVVFDKTVSDETRDRILGEGRIVHELPMVYFTQGSETGDDYNWFMPNQKGFRALVEGSGFAVDLEATDGGSWGYLSAQKVDRTFVPDFEGFNPGAPRA